MSSASTAPTRSQAEEHAREAARSWKGKFIRDAYERQIGLVHSVVRTDEGEWCLLARFPGEAEDREIFLCPRPDPEDINYTSPDPKHVRARYRPPTEEDRERVKAVLAARRNAG